MADVNPISGVPFGQEATPGDHLARAAWELEQATKLRASRPKGYQSLVAAHEQTARAYEELARTRGASLPRRQIPGIGAWNRFAGGSAAAPGKHSYSLNVPEGEYHVDPISTPQGRHRGYSLKFAARQPPRGGHSGLWHDLGMHRSPAKAAVAARRHYAASY